MQSENIDKLAAALVKVQSVLKSAPKDRVNPHFKNRYADLATVWDTIRKDLTDNGLAVVQKIRSNDSGVTVETMLLHTSGQYISDECFLPASKKDPQGYGSAITYARRYGLCSMVGVVADDDDDANDASTPAPKREVGGAAARPAQVTMIQRPQQGNPADDLLRTEWLDRIRNASTKEELDKLVPDIGKLAPALKDELRRAFVARSTELMAK